MKTRIVFLLSFLMFCFTNSQANKESSPVVFTFPEYQYKENSKNEIAFREAETDCEQSRSCSNLVGAYHIRCVRECVSPVCYRELYSQDPLEEGEIDVRLISFKGCFIQKSGRARN